jgi:hypothetical protein
MNAVIFYYVLRKIGAFMIAFHVVFRFYVKQLCKANTNKTESAFNVRQIQVHISVEIALRILWFSFQQCF